MVLSLVLSTRSVSILGVYDTMNNIIPSQTIIAGNTISKIKSTMGVNTLFPETDNYVLDINGPVKISHSEIIEVVKFSILLVLKLALRYARKAR